MLLSATSTSPMSRNMAVPRILSIAPPDGHVGNFRQRTIQGRGLTPVLAVDDPDVDFDQPRPANDPILDVAVERIGKKKAA